MRKMLEEEEEDRECFKLYRYLLNMFVLYVFFLM